jgi:23S rRNA (uracil747-C5)-methyltransferase
MLRLVLRSREALDRIAARIAVWQQERPTVRVVSVNLLPEHRAATEGAEELILSAESSIRCVLNEVEFWLPPGAFLQTNSDIAAELYRRARDWLAPAAGLVIDLYCGVGAFARHLVRADRRLIGVESNTRAIDAARRAPGGVEFLADDATQYVLAHPQADAMVINPPRAGMSAELSTALQRTGPALLLYSSCNPETLARDLLRLPSYRPVRAQLFDMFPHTEHAEILVLMQRN